ncbi:unnamed protein product [Boreogadus saida]
MCSSTTARGPRSGFSLFRSFLRGLTPPALPLALGREPQTPGGGAEGTHEGLTMQHQAGDEGEPPEPTQEAQEEGAPVGSSSAFSEEEEEEEEEEEDATASTQEGPLPSAQSAVCGGGGAGGGGGGGGGEGPATTSSSPSSITCCPPSGLLLGLTVLLLSLLGSWAVVHLTLGTRGGAPFRISTSYDRPVSRDAPATIEPRFTTNCTSILPHTSSHLLPGSLHLLQDQSHDQAPSTALGCCSVRGRRPDPTQSLPQLTFPSPLGIRTGDLVSARTISLTRLGEWREGS